MLGRSPEALQMLASSDTLCPREPAELAAAMGESAARQDDPTSAVAAARGVRRQELLRTAFGDLFQMCGVEQVCAALSATTDAMLETALEVAMRAVAEGHGLPELPIRFAVIAMG